MKQQCLLLRLFVFISSAFYISCSSPGNIIKTPAAGEPNILENLLEREAEKFKFFIDNKDSLRLQIIYTQINRDSKNNPSFKDYTFNLNNQYFYPASTVKLPIALLSLEKLNELKQPGVNRDALMITDSSYYKQQTVFNHPTSEFGKPSVAQYIREMFLVSDNDSYNRLYEFLGQQYINDRLKSKGYKDIEILHRLNVFLTADENRHTNKISFYDTTGQVIYQQEAKNNEQPYSERNDRIGKGFYSGSTLVNEPFNFSAKNRISLSALHDILRSVIFPNSVSKAQRFNLTGSDYNFLYHFMSARPSESKYPVYDTLYHDAYVKFLLFGGEKRKAPDNIRVFNKVGNAYGFLTDVAYIVDLERNIEFMLSATLLCNSDGIFNDNKYDYENVGLPFLKNLGQVIYNYEKQRTKKHIANLDAFRINYKENP